MYFFKLFYNLNLKSIINQTVNYFLFKLNFNHNFNQIYINTKTTSIKNTFIKYIFFKS
jgi:hypothetical protein